MISNPHTQKRWRRAIQKGVENHPREAQKHPHLLQECKSTEAINWCTGWCVPLPASKYKNLQYSSEQVPSFPSSISSSCSPTLWSKSPEYRCLAAWPGCCFPDHSSRLCREDEMIADSFLLIKFVYTADHWGFAGFVSHVLCFENPQCS